MTKDSTLLTKFEERVCPNITFRDERKEYTIGYGLISKENVIIDSVALVDGLNHNLFSIIQLCDKGYEVWFTKEACVISYMSIENILLTGNRKGNVKGICYSLFVNTRTQLNLNKFVISKQS